jgi:ubiquinone/menaquinone biosynthesis C-methylase UbiE
LTKTSTLTNYDQNANHYDQYRRPSPVIQSKLRNLFSGTEGLVLSVGCGTGRMENALAINYHMVGLDRSKGMLTQARTRLDTLVQGDMQFLPFKNNSFSGLYFMQSLHHVGANLEITYQKRTNARKQVLKEAVRVLRSGSIAIIQRDPTQNQAVWFWKYFPRALDTKLKIQPKVDQLAGWLHEMCLSNIIAIPIDDPLAVDFYEPTSPLDPKFRRSFSEFSYLTDSDVKQGICKLKLAINNGSVNEEITKCKDKFKVIGGTVFMVSGFKEQTE